MSSGMGNETKKLEAEIDALKKRIEYLEQILDQAGIPYDVEQNSEPKAADNSVEADNLMPYIIPETITPKHVNYFYSFFKGRTDVYSKRSGKPNPKTGKTGYYTQCWNYWKNGLCLKREGKQIKCGNCENQKYKSLTGNDLLMHLRGDREDCSDVIGIYPMLPDETCNFLVFDFDNHDKENQLDDGANTGLAWKEEVNALREICEKNQICALTERSRSGHGAHIWIFFEKAIPAEKARKFGDALLEKGAESVNLKTFQSYDRMIPAQNHLPEGGLGNLIALPLQGQALKKGNSAFIDKNWKPFENQWKQLGKVQRLSEEFVDNCIKEWVGQEKTSTVEEIPKPWKKRTMTFNPKDLDGKLQVILANRIYVDITNVKPRMQNQIRRIAAYSNPEFYKNQAIGRSVQGIPRFISCSEEDGNYISIPRGCYEKLQDMLKNARIQAEIKDERQGGKKIRISFKGALYPEQQEAADHLLKYDQGVLSAATAFGKTAVGSWLVAERKVNTLVLVHNTEIMKNWVEDFEKFLCIDEPLPEYRTPTGRLKKRKSVIGRKTSAHDSMNGILDVAMISSLGREDKINEIVKQYGMVIMDECHHAAAQIAQEVLNEVNAKYVYGLTATPKRDDGQEQKIFMQFGPIRYKYTAKDRAKKQGIEHFVYPRFTRLISPEIKKMPMNEANKLIIGSEIRNNQIIDDVKQCLEQKRTPLVITKSRVHAEYLYKRLESLVDHIFLLEGGKKLKERDEIREQMKRVPADESVILVATGQYIGEGFNYPRLDTMMLAMPISFEGNVEQYSGRLHRDYDTKKDVIIYDYVDMHIPQLERMYHKRMKTYRKMGYDICVPSTAGIQQVNTIYDFESYIEVYKKDLESANKEIIISSPGINKNKIETMTDIWRNVQERGTKVIVLTLSPEKYPKERIKATTQLIQTMKNNGVLVEIRQQMHEHYAIIDREVVWYGSMNLLSREREDDNLMRIRNAEMAGELLEMDFG